jgi:ribosomal subunit interface protein
VPLGSTDRKGFLLMDIVFKGRHTDVLERFRKHAASKLAKMEKLDQKVIRVDVEVTTERNPRQAGRKERVELTITTRGPVIRAEAAAEDRFAALDLALGKLESRLRKAGDRRKDRHGSARPVATAASAASAADLESGLDAGLGPVPPGARIAPDVLPLSRRAPEEGELNGASWPGQAAGGPAGPDEEKIVPIAMEGDGPLVVREKMHVACPMTIDQALFEMELVGHDFFLFTDTTDGLPSVVYRRRGYQYGVIRLVEEASPAAGRPPAGLASERPRPAANLASG